MDGWRDSAGQLVPADVQHALDDQLARVRRDWSEKRLAFFPDYGAESPVWVGGAMARLDDLPINEGLRVSLRDWSLRYWDQDSASPEAARSYLEEGWRLAEQLRAQLGTKWTVDVRLDDASPS